MVIPSNIKTVRTKVMKSYLSNQSGICISPRPVNIPNSKTNVNCSKSSTTKEVVPSFKSPFVRVKPPVQTFHVKKFSFNPSMIISKDQDQDIKENSDLVPYKFDINTVVDIKLLDIIQPTIDDTSNNADDTTINAEDLSSNAVETVYITNKTVGEKEKSSSTIEELTTPRMMMRFLI